MTEIDLYDDEAVSRLKLPNHMYWYMGTPYAKYEAGHNVAFEDAAEVAAKLLERGVYVFAPIVHTHPISRYVRKTSNVDHDFWIAFDISFMTPAHGMLVVKLPGWDKSRGVAWEIEFFKRRARPVVSINV